MNRAVHWVPAYHIWAFIFIISLIIYVYCTYRKKEVRDFVGRTSIKAPPHQRKIRMNLWVSKRFRTHCICFFQTWKRNSIINSLLRGKVIWNRTFSIKIEKTLWKVKKKVKVRSKYFWCGRALTPSSRLYMDYVTYQLSIDSFFVSCFWLLLISATGARVGRGNIMHK
jgi:hypothetical protein